MKKVLAAAAILAIVILLTVLFAGFDFFMTPSKPEVYVGVTYCGNSVEGGKLLIDKVKHYSNLFVLQSSSLQRDFGSVNQLGDYAISSGLFFLPYFGTIIESTFSTWLETAKQRWGKSFLGVYYGDEPGGKMLDDYVEFKDAATSDSITKTKYGDIVVRRPDGIVIHYEINGVIHLSEPIAENGNSQSTYLTFCPNGTIIGNYTGQSTFRNYEDLMSLKPFKDKDETALRFVSRDQDKMECLKNNSIKIFTSDYALYWWDYLSGYDVIFAQIGWNISTAQQIASVRGAATMQNRDYGIVITWKYNTSPYLDNATEILGQMRAAYECGAKYFVLFNYYEDDSNPFGTLKDEHFKALETFWNDVVKNPGVTHRSVTANSVIVLPRNYGWGMRWQEEKIWGIFEHDNDSQELWDFLRSALKKHEWETDIAYDDQRFPVAADYQYIYRWPPSQ